MDIFKPVSPLGKSYVLYYDSANDPSGHVCNAGFAEALRNATLLERNNICRVVDIGEEPDEELQRAYDQAVGAAVIQKYQIRRVFGTRRQSGIYFGSEVPALLVIPTLLGSQNAEDVYPHIREGRCVTIREALDELLQDPQVKLRLGR